MPTIAVNSSYTGSPVCVILINDDDHDPYLCFSLLFLSPDSPLPPVNFLHVSTITAPLDTKVTVINLSIFCNICPSSYISNNTVALLQYIFNPISDPLFLKKWELLTVPPVCPHICDGPWRRAVCKCQDLSPRSPHYWQPFMLCDYDFPPSVSRWTQPLATVLAFLHRILPFHMAQKFNKHNSRCI